MLKKFWLLFAQACTLCVAALFVVTTLRPDLLPRLAGKGNAVVLLQQPAAAASPAVASYAEAAKKAMLDTLPKMDSRVADPNSNVPQQPPYCKNEARSIKPEWWVAVGICTHLGCSPTYRPEVAPADLGNDWLGGFFCPCHQSKFDLAGRVFKGVPAPTNLVIPPYHYESDTKVVIGEDPKK